MIKSGTRFYCAGLCRVVLVENFQLSRRRKAMSFLFLLLKIQESSQTQFLPHLSDPVSEVRLTILITHAQIKEHNLVLSFSCEIPLVDRATCLNPTSLHMSLPLRTRRGVFTDLLRVRSVLSSDSAPAI